MNHGRVNMESSATGGGTDLFQMRPDGSEVRPLFAKTQLHLERTNVNLNASNPRELNPMFVRIIRLQVKNVRNGMNSCVPEKDAFVDTWNRETGVSVPGWNKQALLHFALNKEKYKVLDDMRFTLECPIMYTGETLVPTMLNQQLSGAVNFSRGNGATYKNLTFHHDLGEKLGYDLGRDTSSQSCAPNSGMNQEYILCHFQYIGDDPAETAAGLENSADKIRLTCSPVSAFVDI